jgi:UDP-N-acetyl-2-amino-2-deoxyglucuronate dehydrogenase
MKGKQYMVRFGIIGTGMISKIFSQAIEATDGAQLCGVYDVDPERAKGFAAAHGVKSYGSLDGLLSSDIDAVYIGTPSGLHAELAVKAAGAGKHIVVEKPMGITAEQLDAIEEACTKNSVKLCAISQMYFSDAFQRLKKAADSGELGRVFLADLAMKYFRTDEYYKNGGWRGTWKYDGGGALMNQGIHGVGLMLELMGRPKSVSALARTFVHPIEVEDTAAAVVEFESGAIGSIIGTTSVLSAKPRRLSIHGSKGTVTLTEDAITEWSIEGQQAENRDAAEIATSAAKPEGFTSELHARQLRQFISALSEGGEPVLGVREGRMPVELILGIYESSRTGKTVYFS